MHYTRISDRSAYETVPELLVLALVIVHTTYYILNYTIMIFVSAVIVFLSQRVWASQPTATKTKHNKYDIRILISIIYNNIGLNEMEASIYST